MDSIYTAFGETVRRFRERPALMARRDGVFATRTYGALEEEVQRAAAALEGLGLLPGDRIGIFSYNQPEWAIADLATHAIGGVVVPIYHTLTADVVSYILRDSGARLLLVQNEHLLRTVLSIRHLTPDLEHVVLFEGEVGEDAGEGVSQWSALLEDVPDVSEKLVPDTGRDDLATIVYTSGTTGEPKGVMLSHGNLLSNVDASRERFHVTHEDVYLSYLPLAHVFERTCGYYLTLLSGGAIAYAGSLATVIADIQEIHPTILSAVPRAIEKAYDTIVQKLEAGPPVQRRLAKATIDCLNEHANRLHRGQRVSLFLRGKCAVLNAVIASKFRRITGKRLRLIASGGAPLDRKLAKVLYVLGFNILEGYGLTETSPTITSTSIEDLALGTVGTPLPSVEVKIGEHDEILVRGPNVMKGYFNRPEETAKAIDGEGFFHTGDCGCFDEKGHLVITGRIKDLIITSYGKNIAPTPIEADLARHPLVQQAMLCGDNRKFISALLVPDLEAVSRLAAEVGLEDDSRDADAVLEDERVRHHFEALVEETNENLANYEKIRRFCFLTEVPSVENGLLTPTLKLRRGKVMDRYADTIDALYDQASPGEGGR